MSTWLRQSTAVDIPMGPFLDSTDGNTQETGLTITQPDIRLKKNGGDWAQKNAAQTLSHEEAGWYEVALDTTDTATLGHLVVAIHEAGALAVWREFMVVSAMVYDSLIAGGDLLDVNVGQWLGTAAATPTVAGVPEVDLTHWLGTAAAAPTVAGVPEVDITHVNGAAQVSSFNTIDDFLDTEVAAILAAVDTEVAAILAQVNLIPGTIDGKTFAQGWSLAMSALFGKASGLATTTATYRSVNDTADRIVATVDANGNRTAVTLTPA